MKPNIGMDGTSLLIMMMVSAGAVAGERVVEADLHEHVTNAFINPSKVASLPRVLIIGDSISIGYTEPVRGNLKGIADVFRPPENCQHTGYGLAQIKAWLGTGKWDVIHFNFGIWDTHLLDSKGNLVRSIAEDNKDHPPAGDIRIRHTPEQYRENLSKLVEILKGTGAKLIWASTTPVMFRTGERFEAIPTLNRIAADLMQSHGVATDDLYAFVRPQVQAWQDPDQCHFNAQLGKQVAESILTALRAGTNQPAATWSADQKSDATIEGRRVLRFEHDCLKDWGYTEKTRQYFYVVEPKLKDNGPLMVCLHSGGANPDKFENGRLEMPGNVKRVADAGDDFTGLILNSGIGSEWWWGADEIKANPDKYKQTLAPVENRILATIEWVARKYHVDRNRIYMHGISMGGSGTLGIGMCHGDVFAALCAGVPASANHMLLRQDMATDKNPPPALAFFSQIDPWSAQMPLLIKAAKENRYAFVCAWGPWGHANHYEMTNPAVFKFPWLSIRRNEAYPAFGNASTDEKFPGCQSKEPDQEGQINAFFRWINVKDQPDEFVMQIRLVTQDELKGRAPLPKEVVADVTLRRIQRFKIQPERAYRWTAEMAGAKIANGIVKADKLGLITVPGIKVTAQPLCLSVRRKE